MWYLSPHLKPIRVFALKRIYLWLTWLKNTSEPLNCVINYCYGTIPSKPFHIHQLGSTQANVKAVSQMREILQDFSFKFLGLRVNWTLAQLDSHHFSSCGWFWPIISFLVHFAVRLLQPAVLVRRLWLGSVQATAAHPVDLDRLRHKLRHCRPAVRHLLTSLVQRYSPVAHAPWQPNREKWIMIGSHADDFGQVNIFFIL